MSKFPFSFVSYDSDKDTHLKKMFKGHSLGFTIAQPGRFVMPHAFRNYAEKIYNMEARPDDIWVLSWPKAGTTWTQELVWTLHNDCDTKKAKELDLWKKWHFIEYDCFLAGAVSYMFEGMTEEEKLLKNHFYQTTIAPSPRYIKSHLPLSMLPHNLLDTCKVIYVARNPMDCCVSFYHHCKSFKNHNFNEEFEDFFDLFINDDVPFSPYWLNILEAWEQRNHKNMCFLFYEEMKEDLPRIIRKVGKFLGKIVSEEEEDKMVEHLSFSSMKSNPRCNMEVLKEMGTFKKDASFIRKGIVGDWKNYFTPDMTKKLKIWYKKNSEDSDIGFPGVKF